MNRVLYFGVVLYLFSPILISLDRKARSTPASHVITWLIYLSTWEKLSSHVQVLVNVLDDWIIPLTFVLYYIITGRNEVLAKVIFSQACVILSTGGGGLVRYTPPSRQAPPPKIWSRHPPPKIWSRHPPRKFGAGTPPENLEQAPPPGYGQRSAGTHPTGMHSCLQWNWNQSYCVPYTEQN